MEVLTFMSIWAVTWATWCFKFCLMKDFLSGYLWNTMSSISSIHIFIIGLLSIISHSVIFPCIFLSLASLGYFTGAVVLHPFFWGSVVIWFWISVTLPYASFIMLSVLYFGVPFFWDIGSKSCELLRLLMTCSLTHCSWTMMMRTSFYYMVVVPWLHCG